MKRKKCYLCGKVIHRGGVERRTIRIVRGKVSRGKKQWFHKACYKGYK